MAVYTLGHLLALHVTPAGEQDRAQLNQWPKARCSLAEQVQDATGDSVEVAFVDQGYTGDQPTQDAAAHDIHPLGAASLLKVVKLPKAKKGFVLLPRRWVVERSFAWVNRFRRLARDYERLPETLAGFHFLALASLMLRRFVDVMAQSSQHALVSTSL